jgi:beta-alanine--pyruvate transaminase
LPQRVNEISPQFQEMLHGLKGCKHVTDIRNYGLAGALTINSAPGEPALRPYKIAMSMWQKGFYVRYGGVTIQMGLPFTTEPGEIDRLINALGETLNETE